MKNKIILLSLAASLFVSCSKQGTMNPAASGNVTLLAPAAVPSATTTAFSNEFSGSANVEWMRSGSGFTVQFNHNGQRHSAGYDDSGHRSSHSVICTDGPVPQLVLDAFRQQFSTDLVYEWSLRNDGTWRAHFMRGTVKYEATFTATGSLLKFERSA